MPSLHIHRRTFDDPERAAAQERIIGEALADPEYFLEQYCKDARSFNGRYVNSDLMKETFPLYSASNEARNYYNIPFHNAAAALAEKQFFRIICDKSNLKQNTMLFVTGSPGAGKSSGITGSGQLTEYERGIFEGQLANIENALPKIEATLNNGLKPLIRVIHTTAQIALENTIYRFGQIGRGASINTISAVLGNLYNGLSNIKNIFSNYIDFEIIDKRNQSKPVILHGWDNINLLASEGDYERVKTKLSEYLEQIKHNISPDAYDQAAGNPPRRPMQLYETALGFAGGFKNGIHTSGHGSGISGEANQGTILKAAKKRHRMR
jgi:hypothetical protein